MRTSIMVCTIKMRKKKRLRMTMALISLKSTHLGPLRSDQRPG